MRTTRWILVGCCLAVAALPAPTQPPTPKPGPEHEMLKDRFVGTWDVTASFGGMLSKGTATCRMTLGGFWLVEHFNGEVAGQKFEGRGTIGYDPVKKTYTATWIDSMSPSLLVMEGSFDKPGKTFTETGEGMGHGGKKMKMKSVYQFTDKDSFTFTMYDVTDGKDQEMMKLTYKRKK